MSSVTTTAFGPPSIERLGDLLDRHRSGDLLGRAVVVCASSLAPYGVRRALGRRPGGVAGVDVVTTGEFLTRLANERVAANGWHQASDAEIQAMVASELAVHPGQFGRVAGHRTTQQRLVTLHHQLSGVGDQTRRRLATQATGLAADAVRVVSAVMNGAGPARCGDQIVDLAIEELASRRDGSMGPIIVYLPEPVRPSDGRLLQALARRDDCHVLVGMTGEADIDRRHLRRLAGWSIQVAPSIPIEAPKGAVIEVGDPDDEGRVAVGDIAAHAALGTPLSDMAIIYSTSDPYESLLVEHLDAANIAWVGPLQRPLAQSVVGRFLRRAVDMGANGIDRAALMTLVSAAPVADEQGIVPAPQWDELSRRAGVIDGSQWEPRLGLMLTQLRQDHDRYSNTAEGSDDPGNKADQLTHQIALVERLMGFVATMQESLQPDPTPSCWFGWSHWAQNLLDTFLLPTKDWPLIEQQSRELVVDMLKHLRCLDELAPNPSIEMFGAMITSQLEAITANVRPHTHGLLVAPVNEAPGIPFERLVMVGLAEGVFPRVEREDSVLPDRLRAAAGGMLLPTGTTTEIDVRAVAAVLASSRQRPVVTTPRGDLRSARSWSWPRALDQLVDVDTRVLDSHHQVVVDHGWPSSASALRVRALVDHVEGGDPVHTHELATSDQALGRTLTRGLNRHRGDLNRHTGKVPAGLIDAGQRMLSPTSLEDYAGCPRSYLLGRVLRLGREGNRERTGEIRALDRGSLTHEILERFVAEALASQTVPTPDQPWDETQVARLHHIATEELRAASARGLTGGRVSTAILERQLLSEMDLFIATDNQFRSQYRSTPRFVELGFGFDEEPSVVRLQDGRTLRLRGRVDRVDTTEDGDLVVIDYKGGSGAQYNKIDKNPLDGGRRLQLALYARVLAEKLEADGARQALYWLTSRGQIRLVNLDDEVDTDLDRIVSAALDGISKGVFPGVPGAAVGWPRLTFSNCAYCDFDPICPTDRQREWDSVRHDESLTSIKVLVDGQVE